MQFHHAFRIQVAQALEQELPEALRRWLADGAEVVRMPLPDGGEVPLGVRSRRVTFECALRSARLASRASRSAAVTSTASPAGPAGRRAFVRPAADRDPCQLRDEAAFTAACQAIPGALRAWPDPGRTSRHHIRPAQPARAR